MILEEKLRCQSCGMPLSESFYGSNLDGSENQEYCRFCFQQGSFTLPDLTLKQMIEMSVENMTQDLKMPEDRARELATTFIPTLKRWSSNHA